MNEPVSGPSERRVRDALHDTVDDLEPAAGLAAIRARLQEDPMSRTRPRSAPRTALIALAGAAAVAVVVTGVALATEDAGRPSGDGGVATEPVSPEPSPVDTGSPDTTGETTPPATPLPSAATDRTLPVYYVGDNPVGPRLFREFHRVEVVPGDELGRALRQAVEAPPFDPDYRSPWPEGTRVNEAVSLSSEQQVVIDLSGSSAGSLRARPDGMSREEARMAVEQLIYTAQAVVQDRVPVQLLLDGQRTDQVLGVPASEPLANGEEMSTLSTVWITSPAERETFRPGPVAVTGQGAFFEANVAWQLLAEDTGDEVATGYAMARECCTLAPYTFSIPSVAPGTYTLRVYDADMSGGEGPGETEDTKTIIVE